MNRREFDAYTALRDTAKQAPPADRAVLAAARHAVAIHRRRRMARRVALAAVLTTAAVMLWGYAGLPVSLFAFRY